MLLESDYVYLFKINSQIKELVSSLYEKNWEENDYRQKKFKVHKDTKSIIFVWSGFSDSNYKNVKVLIDRNHSVLSNAVWDIADKIKSKFNNGRITKLMLAKLNAKASILPHTDGANLAKIRRCHYVVKTNENCIFTIGKNSYNFKENECFEFNNQLEHGVINNGDPRIHLICDILEE